MAYLAFAASSVWLNTAFFAFCNLIILMMGYQVTLKKAVLHALLLTGLVLSTEFLGTLILGAVLQNYSQYQSDMTALLLLAVFSKLLFYLGPGSTRILPAAGKVITLSQGRWPPCWHFVVFSQPW